MVSFGTPAKSFDLVAGLFNGDMPTVLSFDHDDQATTEGRATPSGVGINRTESPKEAFIRTVKKVKTVSTLTRSDSRDSESGVGAQDRIDSNRDWEGDYEQQRAVTSLAACPDHGILACGTAQGCIELHRWDDAHELWNRTATHSDDAHAQAVTTLLWLGTTLISGSIDMHIVAWELHDVDAWLSQLTRVRRFEGGDDVEADYDNHESAVTALVEVSTRPESTTDTITRQFASGSTNGAIRIWDAHADSPERSLHLNAGGVTCLAWLQHGWLASGHCTSSKIVLTDLRDSTGKSRLVATSSIDSKDGVHSLLWMPRRSWLLSGDRTGNVRVWRITSNSGRVTHGEVLVDHSPTPPLTPAPDNGQGADTDLASDEELLADTHALHGGQQRSATPQGKTDKTDRRRAGGRGISARGILRV